MPIPSFPNLSTLAAPSTAISSNSSPFTVNFEPSYSGPKISKGGLGTALIAAAAALVMAAVVVKLRK